MIKSTDKLIQEYLDNGGQITKVPPDPKFRQYYKLNPTEFINWWYKKEKEQRAKEKEMKKRPRGRPKKTE